MSAARELEDLYAAARRASCRVTHSYAEGAHAAALIDCPDGWAAARMLTALAESDVLRPDVQQIALMLRVAAPSDDAFARAVQAFVKANVAFVREKGEVFTGPAVTLGAGFGDCDDHARLVYAVAKAGGIPARMALLYRRGAPGPSHAVAQLGVSGAWWWAETTVDALFGEQPFDAAKRLGLLGERQDIATEVQTMSDKDLPPAPKTLRSTAQQIRADAQALEALGYICDLATAEDIERADDPRFRQAVADFQRARGGLTIDGLIGPNTRNAIADALVKAGAPGELAAGYIAGLGEIAVKYSGHLSSEFFRNVEAMASRMREKGADVNAVDFLNAWLSESGIGKAKHGHGGLDYHGLNMMHGPNLPGLGWTLGGHAFGEADPADQIVYIERFYVQMVKAFLGGDWSKLNNATALYLMNFLPAYTKHADNPDYVLARKGEANGWWRDNPVFDPERKGYIEVADLTRQLERVQKQSPAYWSEVVMRAQLEGGTVAPSGISRAAGLVAGGLVVLLAAGVFASVLTHGGDKAAVRSELRARARDLVAAPGRVLATVRR